MQGDVFHHSVNRTYFASVILQCILLVLKYCIKVLKVCILFEGTGAATIENVIRHVLSGRVQSHGEGKRRVETVKLEGFVH